MVTKYGTSRIFDYEGDFEFSSRGTEAKQSRFTFYLAGLHLVVTMVLFVTGLYLEYQSITMGICKIYTMIYMRCGFWLFTFIVDMIATHRQRELRHQGHYQLYLYIKVKSTPFFIVTFGNMIIYFVHTIMSEMYGPEYAFHCNNSPTSPLIYLCIICGLETLVLTIIQCNYMVKMCRFNTALPLPEALNDIERPIIGSLGINFENGKVIDLLEKQADIIFYLKEQNFNLKRKLQQLNQELYDGSYEKI